MFKIILYLMIKNDIKNPRNSVAGYGLLVYFDFAVK